MKTLRKWTMFILVRLFECLLESLFPLYYYEHWVQDDDMLDRKGQGCLSAE